jgi:hypothetical protein
MGKKVRGEWDGLVEPAGCRFQKGRCLAPS